MQYSTAGASAQPASVEGGTIPFWSAGFWSAGFWADDFWAWAWVVPYATLPRAQKAYILTRLEQRFVATDVDRIVAYAERNNISVKTAIDVLHTEEVERSSFALTRGRTAACRTDKARRTVFSDTAIRRRALRLRNETSATCTP